MKHCRRILAVATAIALGTASLAHAECCDRTNSFGFGLGAGRSNLSGDFMASTHLTDVAMGLDLEQKNLFFSWRAITDTDNKVSSTKIALGAGWPRFKIGLGYFYQTLDVPPAVPSGFLAAPDQTRSTTMTIHSIPLYLRFRPVVNEHFNATVEAYYGFDASGTMKVPLSYFPGGDIETEPKPAGGMRGGDIRLQWWPWERTAMSFLLELAQDEGQMDRAHTSFNPDPLGLFGTVDVPQIQYRTRQVLLSVLMPL